MYKKEPSFTSGSAIIKQFFLAVLDFRNSVNRDDEVISDAMWFDIMTCVMRRIREDCYLSDEANEHGYLTYPVENIIHHDQEVARYPTNCIILDAQVTADDIIDSGILIDITNPLNIRQLRTFAKSIAVDEENAQFANLAYSYCERNFDYGRFTVYTNLILMHTLITIFNEEILDAYYTIAGFAEPVIDQLTTLMMRNTAPNTILNVLASCWTVRVPERLLNKLELEPGEIVGLEDACVKVQVACTYPPVEEFTLDGRDIFRCKIIPTQIGIGFSTRTQ